MTDGVVTTDEILREHPADPPVLQGPQSGVPRVGVVAGMRDSNPRGQEPQPAFQVHDPVFVDVLRVVMHSAPDST